MPTDYFSAVSWQIETEEHKLTRMPTAEAIFPMPV